MQRTIGAALQVLGLVAVTIGVGLVLVWAGVVVGGLSAFAVGYQLEAQAGDS